MNVVRATPEPAAINLDSVTDYEARCAQLVAAMLDRGGNSGSNLRDSFTAAATQGLSPAAALRSALDLLVALGFVTVESDYYRPAAGIKMLSSAEVGEATQVLRRAAAALLEATDASQRQEIGDAAERHVVQLCVADLQGLGRDDFAEEVVQVSQINDRFGYDVSAPTIDGPARLLEVKGSTRGDRALFTFFLTRNEYSVGRSQPGSWFLVACSVTPTDDQSADQNPETSGASPALTVDLLGYCRAAMLTQFLPDDANGRWTEAFVSLPRHLLIPGLPTAIP